MRAIQLPHRAFPTAARRLGTAVIAASLLTTMGAAAAAAAAAPQCPGTDDAFEDNDDCGSAATLPLGLTQGLYTETRAGDHDYFRFEVPAGEVLTVDLLFAHSEGNVDVMLYGADCAGVLGIGFSQTDDERVEVANAGSSALDVVIEVFVSSVTGTDCNTYDILLSTATDPCASAADDAFEPNDDCSSATPIVAGAYPGLRVFQGGPDHYRFTIPPGDELRVDCGHTHSAGDVNLFLFDPAVSCGGGFAGAPLVHSITQTDDESLVWANGSAAPVDVVLEVSLSSTVPSGCNAYALDIAVVADECVGPDDPLEGGDDCASALAIGPGLYADLFVSDDDPDFYSVTVPPGDVLGVHCDYVWANGAIALVLWNPAVACGTGWFTQEVALGLTPVDNERLFWLNDTGSTTTIVVEVAMGQAQLGRCNHYDLRVETFADPCPGGLGEIFCRGNPNSTGTGSSLCALGSDLVADNNVLLTATSLPQDSLGYFIVSREPNVTLVSPLGSSGQLCVASPSIGRQAPVLGSGAAGTVQFQLDLTLTPQPSGPVAIAPGETWCWQLWHRDVGPGGTTTSNFSSARSIQFR